MKKYLLLLVALSLLLLAACGEKNSTPAPEPVAPEAVAEPAPEPEPEPEPEPRTTEILGQVYDCTVTELDLTESTVTAPEELEGLQELEGPVTVDLRGTLRSLEEMEAFQAAWPNADFLFSFNLSELGMPKLEVDSLTDFLDLNKVKIKDIDLLRRYLNQLPALQQVELCSCGLSNEELAGLREEYPTVKVVWLLTLGGKWTLRTDAEAFSTLVADKKTKHLSSKDCEIFRYCTDLKALDLGHHVITDISFLYDLPELRVLILAMNSISDITPIASLEKLTFLELFGNTGITTLEPLSGLTNLRDLNISYNRKAMDFEYLYGLTNLERLWMAWFELSEEQIAGLQEHLPNCTLSHQKYGSSATGDGWRECEKHEAIRTMFRSREYNPIFEP